MEKLCESQCQEKPKVEAVDQLLLGNTMCSARAMIAVGGGGRGGEFEWEREGGKSWRAAAVREKGAIEGRGDSAATVN